MRVYVDHNFLIYCANQPPLLEGAIEGSHTHKVSFVLSPWHFYEVANDAPERASEILAVVEKLNPLWILDRADLQLSEFQLAWTKFWGMPIREFAAVGSLSEVCAVLLRKTPADLLRFKLGDYARVLRLLAHQSLIPVLDNQEAIAAANQQSFREGKLTPDVVGKIQVSYVVQQLARVKETGPYPDELEVNMQAIRQDSFTFELVRFFVKKGGLENLPCWQVESVLTDHHHAGKAKLNRNRQLDRQHAVAALAYCDCLITDDDELSRLCKKVKERVPFTVAKSLKAVEFMASLGLLQPGHH